VATNIYLGSATGALSITDGTSLNAANRIITIGDGTILQGSVTTSVQASLPPGITSAIDIKIDLRLDSARSTFNLSSKGFGFPPSITIRANNTFIEFEVSGSNLGGGPSSLAVTGNSLSFTVEEGIVTV